jgi:DNA-binding beta-propeller fold protein YncE
MTLDGDIIVSWGHGDPIYTTGEGTAATGPGGFNLPHDVTVDDDDRVYVMDRENERCQVFDNQGQYLTEWKDIGAPNDSVISGGLMYIAGANPKSLRVTTLDGVEVGRWDEIAHPELFEGYPHGMWIDREGSIHVTEVGARNRLLRFVRA